jgi:hypothetical protein
MGRGFQVGDYVSTPLGISEADLSIHRRWRPLGTTEDTLWQVKWVYNSALSDEEQDRMISLYGDCDVVIEDVGTGFPRPLGAAYDDLERVPDMVVIAKMASA